MSCPTSHTPAQTTSNDLYRTVSQSSCLPRVRMQRACSSGTGETLPDFHTARAPEASSVAKGDGRGRHRSGMSTTQWNTSGSNYHSAGNRFRKLFCGQKSQSQRHPLRRYLVSVGAEEGPCTTGLKQSRRTADGEFVYRQQHIGQRSSAYRGSLWYVMFLYLSGIS